MTVLISSQGVASWSQIRDLTLTLTLTLGRIVVSDSYFKTGDDGIVFASGNS